MRIYAHPNFENWQYQPVHNVYLLIFSELGTVGLILFLLFLSSIFFRNSTSISKIKNNYVLTIYCFCCIVFSFLVISFFDHYFWDMKLGTLIFVLPLIILYTPYEENRKIRQGIIICYNQKVLNLIHPPNFLTGAHSAKATKASQ